MTFRPKPLSLSLFTILFVMLFLILLFTLGNLTYREFEQLDNKFRIANEHSAAAEIESALSEAISQTREKTRQLAAWEEVGQQLNNPTFYSYWYQYRAKNIEYVSAYTLDVAIYDLHGNMLAPMDTSILPRKIDTDGIGHYIQVNNFEPLIVVIIPVKESNSGKKLGYLATLSNLFPVLKGFSHFNHIDRNSIRVTIDEIDMISSQSLLEYIDYRLTSDPYAQAIKPVVKQSLLQLAGTALILTLLIFPLAAWLVNRPILQISQQIDQLQSSPRTAVKQQTVKPLFIKELDKIQTSLYAYHNRLNQANSYLDQKTQELDDIVQHDPLTGVMNRRAFDSYWREVTDVFKHSADEICLILFDINHFKALNDTYGHHTGDQVLIAVAQTLKHILHSRDQLFRLSGDEFATILMGIPSRKAMQIAKQCHLAVINYPFDKLGINEPVRISIGVADIKAEKGENINALHWQADIAIHFAKRPGYSSIIRFKPELAENARGLFSNRTHTAVYEAVTRGTGLVMHYQPIVDLENGKPQYYEALVRIVHDGQLIMPSHIFPLVEARSLDLDLDFHVIEKAISDLREGRIPVNTGVSINISAPAIVEHELLQQLAAFKPFMADYKLLIEITETALITQLQTARKNLEILRNMGFSIALDDFGSGYSSLRYLGAMPVDVVKFDITLTRLVDDRADNLILNHLAKMISESGHLLVAEGIESAQIAEQLAKLGFRYGQGYYFGRPARAIEKTGSSKDSINYSA
ncbi:MAG: bifunctional diguanylate cyclase/phosphodiesterase [Candidatus Thiodiazotropha sp. (ex Codakia orbicularis)]|nr:bifunctional diguanylate cyclase/phosphodiesterase [Candidatus Thiodiazotropha sp. (ex Codakia orbicularis)]